MANGGVKFVWPPISIGWIIALIVLVLAIVAVWIGQLAGPAAWFIIGLALARLL